MSGEHELGALILAAGKGTRMKSEIPKVLHLLAGRPLLAYVLANARAVGSARIVVVIGYQSQRVREAFPEEDLIFVEQTAQLGTGHAVLTAAGAFADFQGDVLILCGDVPLLSPVTLQHFVDSHRRSGATLTLLTTIMDDPTGYGRVIKDGEGGLLKIVEERDAAEEQKAIKEINTGIYCVTSSFLFAAAGMINPDNAQKEYYLTDIIEIGRRQGVAMGTVVVADPREVRGINSLADLEEVAGLL